MTVISSAEIIQESVIYHMLEFDLFLQYSKN